MGTCPARRADKSPGLSQDRSVPMCPDSSVAMSPDRSAAMSRDSSVRTFQDSSVTMLPDRFQGRTVRTFPDSNATTCQDRSVTTSLASNVAMFLRRSVPTSQESSARTFPDSSASRCPSRSVTPPSQLTESKEENSFLNTSLSHPAPITPFPLQASVDFENILVNSILCHFHPISLSTIFMSALFKYNMRHSEI